MSQLVIPLASGSANADYTFEVQLGDNLVTIRQLWRTLLGQWFIDGTIDGVTIFQGAALEPYTNILSHWHIESSFGRLILSGDQPTLDNLGTNNTLTWISPDE